jgi:hypothetical protein
MNERAPTHEGLAALFLRPGECPTADAYTRIGARRYRSATWNG